MIVDTSKQIQAKLLAGDSTYTPNYIFVEYRNSTEKVSDTVTADDTIEHYNSLLAGTDYIEVPITIKPVYSYDEATGKYSVTYSTVLSGAYVGELNKGTENELPFSNTSNSLIYSFGLVTRIPTPYGHEDILFARTVLDRDDQIVKATNDMYISWKLDL